MSEVQETPTGQADSQFRAVNLIIDPGQETAPVVPNGTEVLSPRCQQWVARYRSLAKRAAEDIIAMGQAVFFAKNDLAAEKGGYDHFCREIGLEPNGSTLRKLELIGANALRFKPFVERVPKAWTTIYTLANIPQDQFDLVTKSELFGPLMTAKEVSSVIAKTKPVTPMSMARAHAREQAAEAKKKQHQFIVEFTGTDPEALEELIKKLQDAIKPLGVCGEPAGNLRTFLSEHRAKADEAETREYFRKIAEGLPNV